MGKAKTNRKPALRNTNHHDNPNRNRIVKRTVSRRQHSQVGSAPGFKAKNLKHKQSNGESQSQRKRTVPFKKWDRVLLVGEGDFSFALSLASNHPVTSITATSYDSQHDLRQKYPDVEKTLTKLRSLSCSSKPSLGDHTNNSSISNKQETVDVWEGFSSNASSIEETLEAVPNPKNSTDTDTHATTSTSKLQVDIYHSINATALSKTHRKLLRSHSPFTKIVFNFPHTGGLSTDVNRQVRANQELLVGFFNAAKSLLATEKNPARAISIPNQSDSNLENEDAESDDSISENDEDGVSDKAREMQQALSSGQILVTIFEGEPYTLWNVRDLSRHCGLQVIESFGFPWTAYPEYKHARTIGDIVTGKDRSDEGKRKGSWRGEERDARCYVLGLKGELPSGQGRGRKRRKTEDEDSDSSD